MSDRVPEPPTREPFGRMVVRAVALAVVGGALLGSCDALRLMGQGHPRYASWALRMVTVAIGGYALIAVPLAIVTSLVARVLWGRPSDRSAPPSVCAGLGSIAAILALIASDAIGLTLLPLAAIGFTLLFVLLRESLAWWSTPPRATPWVVLAAFASVAAIGAGLTRGPSGSGAASKSAQNVVLLSIDTLRADALGCYGSGVVQTPNLDALAKDGVLFENATSQANITGPSHATMLTGLSPAEHAVLSNGQPLPRKTKTWVEDLALAGYETAGFVSGYTMVDAASGLARRFEYFDDSLFEWRWMPDDSARLRLVKALIRVLNARGRRLQRPDRPATETVDAVEAWLEKRNGQRPFFLFAHFYDPHAPYHPPRPFDRKYDPAWKGEPFVNWYALSTRERKELVDHPAKLAHMVALYRGEISYSDEQAGRLLKLLRERGLYDDALIIVTSDHGEELGEHEIFFDHGATLYDTELHVPLIVKAPKSLANVEPGSRVAAQVRTLDLGATICELTGVNPSYALSGQSLVPVFGASSNEERPAFAFSGIAGRVNSHDLDASAISLRKGGLKLIWTSEHWLDSRRVPVRYELFDLVRDPHEQQNLLGDPSFEPSEAITRMRAALDKLAAATHKRPGPGVIDPATRERLRSLGYFGN